MAVHIQKNIVHSVETVSSFKQCVIKCNINKCVSVNINWKHNSEFKVHLTYRVKTLGPDTTSVNDSTSIFSSFEECGDGESRWLYVNFVTIMGRSVGTCLFVESKVFSLLILIHCQRHTGRAPTHLCRVSCQLILQPVSWFCASSGDLPHEPPQAGKESLTPAEALNLSRALRTSGLLPFCLPNPTKQTKGHSPGTAEDRLLLPFPIQAQVSTMAQPLWP